jgi:hypothetical protein
MLNQQLAREALHIATLLPDDRRDAEAVLSNVNNLFRWAQGEKEGGRQVLVEMHRSLPPLVRPEASSVPVPAATTACLVMFLIGWMIESPLQAGLKHIEPAICTGWVHAGL